MTDSLADVVTTTVCFFLSVASFAMHFRKKRPVLSDTTFLDRQAAARVAMVAIEQLHKGRAGVAQDKARDATTALMAMRPELSPAHARVLVENAVAESKK